jgi:hypothetical protein
VDAGSLLVFGVLTHRAATGVAPVFVIFSEEDWNVGFASARSALGSGDYDWSTVILLVTS